MGVLGMAAASGATVGGRTRYYTFEFYRLKNGDQLPAMHRFFGNVAPKLDAMWTGPKLYLEAVIAPHMPQVAAVYGFSSLEEMASVREKLRPDVEFEYADSKLVEAAPYSPEIAAGEASKTPRIFELRVYHSPTYRQLAALHERFAGPEIKIFHRTGIFPIFYSSTLVGPDMPNLTYLIPFESLAAREKAWTAFAADPEWVRVRKESIDKYGQITIVNQMSLWKAADYSPFK